MPRAITRKCWPAWAYSAHRAGAAACAPGRADYCCRRRRSYLFANPAVCHHIAEVMKLPVPVVVGNNGGMGAPSRAAPKRSTRTATRPARETIPATASTTSPDFRRDRRLQPRRPCRFRAEDLPRRAGRSGIPSYTHLRRQSVWLDAKLAH